MRRRVVLPILLSALAATCRPVHEELPHVRTPLPWDLGCSNAHFGVPALGPAGTQPDLDRCVDVAWAIGCEGRLGFEVTVDQWAEVDAVRFTGDSSVELRDCVRGALTEVVWLPATDCRGHRVSSSVAGGITWTRWSTNVRFGGMSSTDACVRDCGSGHGGRGRTTRCS
jgi:hypothetical protein